MKKLIIIVAILLICVFVIAYLSDNSRNKNVEIFELEEEHIAAITTSTDYRYFVVVNPPSSLTEVKSVIQKYVLSYLQETGVQNDDNGCEHYQWWFFRESKTMNIAWKSNSGYLSTDRVEDHVSDLICVVSWDSSNGIFEYWVTNRSDAQETYGEILEQETYTEILK